MSLHPDMEDRDVDGGAVRAPDPEAPSPVGQGRGTQHGASTLSGLTAVYVLHFDPPFKHAHHYVGFTTHADVATRLDEHMKGTGSRLVRAVSRAGHAVHIAHVFIGADRRFERQIKNRKDVSRWCRICARNERPRPKVTR